MDVSGRIKIFKDTKNGRESYYTTIANKKDDGTYENMGVDVQLPKGTTLDNNTDIEVTKGFLTFYKTKYGYPILKAVILDYNMGNVGSSNSYSSDELPF